MLQDVGSNLATPLSSAREAHRSKSCLSWDDSSWAQPDLGAGAAGMLSDVFDFLGLADPRKQN